MPTEWYSKRKTRGIPGQAPPVDDPTANPTATDAQFGEVFFPTDEATYMGGGLTGVSDIDTATDGDTAKQEEGGNWQSERAHLDQTYADEHSYPGPTDQPVRGPFQGLDPWKLLEGFMGNAYDGARRVRDVATTCNYNTITLNDSTIIPLLGDDPTRRSVRLWTPKNNTGNILVGRQNAFSGQAGIVGAGQVTLDPSFSIELRDTDAIAVCLATGAAAGQLLCYVVENYK